MTEIFLLLLISAIGWLFALIFTASLAIATKVAIWIVFIWVILQGIYLLFHFLFNTAEGITKFFGYRSYLNKEKKAEEEKEKRFQFLSNIPECGYQASLEEDNEYRKYVDLEYLYSDLVNHPRFYTLSSKGRDFLARVRNEKKELSKWE